jgi:hypothetical protein
MRFFKIFKDFENCIDPVKTEEVIFFNLKNDSQNIIYKDYIYIVFPIAESINYYGIDHTQTLIKSICKTSLLPTSKSLYKSVSLLTSLNPKFLKVVTQSIWGILDLIFFNF